jgi:hypothetical protein
MKQGEKKGGTDQRQAGMWDHGLEATKEKILESILLNERPGKIDGQVFPPFQTILSGQGCGQQHQEHDQSRKRQNLPQGLGEVVDSEAQLGKPIAKVPVVADDEKDDSDLNAREVGTVKVLEAPPPQVAKNENRSGGEEQESPESLVGS